MLENENPYQSPASEGPYRSSMCDRIVVFDDSSPLEVAVIRRRSFYRTIRLSGRINAVVEYDGRGLIEKVRVNDETAFAQTNWSWVRIPRLDFGLFGDNTEVPATIEVEGFFGLKTFRLFIGDTLVYAEPPENAEPLE